MYKCLPTCADCTMFMPSFHKSLNRALNPLELELQAVLRCQMWVLGSEFDSSAGVASALKCWAISPPLYNPSTQCLWSRLKVFSDIKYIDNRDSVDVNKNLNKVVSSFLLNSMACRDGNEQTNKNQFLNDSLS